MATLNQDNVENEEDVFFEIMDIILALKKSGKLVPKYRDVVNYLSMCNESWEDMSKSPYEFRIIRLISKDPNTLSEYLNKLFSSETAQSTTEVIYEKSPTPSLNDELPTENFPQLSSTPKYDEDVFPVQDDKFNSHPLHSQEISNDNLVTKIMAISKEWIFKGTFDEIGEKEHCHRAMVAYVTELNVGGSESVAHGSITNLFLLIESGNIEGLITEIRAILIDLRINRPELFLDSIDKTEDTNATFLQIANELVIQGSFEDLGDNFECMLAVSKYLALGPNAFQDYTETCKKILSLHKSGQTFQLKNEVSNIITLMSSPKCSSSKAVVKYSEEEYKEKIARVVEIVNDSILLGAYDDINESKTECIMAALSYLTIKEQDLNQQYVLPKEHEGILILHEKRDIDGLVRYLRKLLINARDTYAFERVELRVQKATKDIELNPEDETQTETSRKVEMVVAILGTTLTTGLSTLHVLVPIAESFKSLIENLNGALLNPALSSWPVLSGVSIAFGAGILVWNAYCVMKRKKSLRLALKDSLDSVGPMAIASAVGGIAALAFATIAPPIWIPLLVFTGLGIVTHFLVQPLVKRFSRWLFFELPENKAKSKAYTTLEVKPNVTDEELRRAYRSQSRKYHPDMQARSDSNEDFSEKLLEVQQAYEYIVSIRLRDMEKASGPGFFARLRKFMANLWKKDDEENAVLAIENSHFFDKIAETQV